MTKPRDPASIDAALARIAGQVSGGWQGMADHAGRSVFTVRKWGDEASPRNISVKEAIALDLLFQAHGGEGRPLYDCYGHLLGVETNRRFIDQFELIGRIADLARENGEAEEALLRLALPGATDSDRQVAQKEVLDAWRQLKALLPLIDCPPPEAHIRAPP